MVILEIRRSFSGNSLLLSLTGPGNLRDKGHRHTSVLPISIKGSQKVVVEGCGGGDGERGLESMKVNK